MHLLAIYDRNFPCRQSRAEGFGRGFRQYARVESPPGARPSSMLSFQYEKAQNLCEEAVEEMKALTSEEKQPGLVAVYYVLHEVSAFHFARQIQ